MSEKIKELMKTDDTENKFIIFRLGQELYGSSLLSIKEVIKLQQVKSVPYMVSYFKGVINLRGQIISVIDLREKLEHVKREDSNGLVLIVEIPTGFLGVIIDDLVTVTTFNESDIEHNPNLETKVPVPFFEGIAKYNDRLVNLIKISECISHDEMRTFKQAA